MSAGVRSRSIRRDEGTKQREVSDQPTPFVGLALAPFVALALTYGIHYAIAGWTIGSWHVPGSDGFMIVGAVVATLAAVAVGGTAWHFSYDRKQVWRYALTASYTFIGLWLPFLVWLGPARWLDTFFVICAWIVAAIWSQPRLHVLRRDPREDGGGEDGDELMRSLGLNGYRHKGQPDIRYDQDGNPERIVVKVKHRFGGKRDALQNALGNIESAVGGPGGLSRVTATDSGAANESLMTVILKDPLVGRVPNPGPSNPGGSPTHWSVVGKYDDGEPVYVWLCGGIDPETGSRMPPTGYAFMGMTRSGKTVTENRLLLDQVITRQGTVLAYLNKAKGGQDAAPIIAGIEAAVLSDGTREYRKAFEAFKDILTYRQKQLARYGISAWSWERCYDDPPTHTVKGDAVPMEPMPALIVHVGEADAILQEAGEDATYLASKGLSVGIIPGWSMQRWSADNMPTSLRFNIGTSFCFGCADDYSADFALSPQTRKAGAHPENWRNRKPGRFFLETIGVEENRFPISAKGIGDVDDDALYLNMRLLAEEWGPRMSRLDTGSVVASRGWWGRQVAITEALRRELTPGPASTDTPPPVPDDPRPAATVTPDRQETDTMPLTPPPGGFTADDLPDDIDPEEAHLLLAQAEVRGEIADATHIGERAIHGELITPDEDDPTGTQLFAELAAVNPQAEVPPPPDDVADVPIDDGKPEAASPEEAQLRFDEAVRHALTREELRDPDDPTGNSVIIRTGQLQRLYPFRARSWYSPMLREMAEGKRVCPPGIVIEKLPDRTGEGWYRIRRTDGDQPSQNGYAG
jgi:hypothetical protein